MKNYIILTTLFIYFSFSIATAQDKPSDEDFISTKTDSIERDIFNPKIEFEKVEKKKKVKKKEFAGYKIKRGFTRVGSADKQTIEFFSYLKEYQDPNPYLQEIYWYSTKEQRIKNTKTIDKDNARILHGPYLKINNGDTIAEGFFYIGAKHSRWTTYKKGYILTNKEKYWKGWPSEAKISYYDGDKKMIKEVVPYEFGQLEGNYYTFYENGLLQEEGRYRNGIKVGKWITYHKLKNKRKTEIQYTNDPYNTEFEPYILREYDEKGKIIYEWKEKAEKKGVND